jgi:hypothetical protein
VNSLPLANGESTPLQKPEAPVFNTSASCGASTTTTNGHPSRSANMPKIPQELLGELASKGGMLLNSIPTSPNYFDLLSDGTDSPETSPSPAAKIKPPRKTVRFTEQPQVFIIPSMSTEKAPRRTVRSLAGTRTTGFAAAVPRERIITCQEPIENLQQTRRKNSQQPQLRTVTSATAPPLDVTSVMETTVQEGESQSQGPIREKQRKPMPLSLQSSMAPQAPARRLSPAPSPRTLDAPSAPSSTRGRIIWKSLSSGLMRAPPPHQTPELWSNGSPSSPEAQARPQSSSPVPQATYQTLSPLVISTPLPRSLVPCRMVCPTGMEEAVEREASRVEEQLGGREVLFGDFQAELLTPATSTTSRATLTTSAVLIPSTPLSNPDFAASLSIPLPSSPPIPSHNSVCLACGAGFSNDPRMGDHFRRAICMEWQGSCPGAHELAAPSLPNHAPCKFCGLPFSVKGLNYHTRICKKIPPRRPLYPPIPPSSPALTPIPHSTPPSSSAPHSVSLPFIPHLTSENRRSGLSTLALLPTCTIPGSAAAQSLLSLMENSPKGEDSWLLNEISSFNVPVKRRSFPKEASEALREALDATLSFALSLHKTSPLAFSASALFVLFPRLILRPLADGCQGRLAAATFLERCRKLSVGDVASLISEAHEAQTERVRGRTAAASTQPHTFSKTARAAALAGAGELGRACKVAFTYGFESDPEVAANFLAKLTLQARHSHVPLHPSSLKPAKNSIPLSAISDAFSKMPKKSAAHRDGWTWELLRDAAQRPSTASHLRKFSEFFANGALPSKLWTYLASALMYPFHKLMLEERIDPKDPALRPVTVGSVLTRFGCRVLVRMNRMAVATQLLLSHQFSFGINGGVQQVILGCTLALQVHPSFLQIDLDLRNAHTFCSRDRIEEELESDIIYNYLLESFRALYGKSVTPQWHYGDGPDRPPTSCHMSIDGLRQGDAPATVYFNILVARVYRKQLALLDGRGILFAISDDLRILAPPQVIREIVEVFPETAWEEAGLTTQTLKNRIFVQPSARNGWRELLDSTPRNPSLPLQIHCIPDGSTLLDDSDPDSYRQWPDDDGINILGTPLGSPAFVESYLFGKGVKHRVLLNFIQDVAAAGFPREAVAMLTGAASKKLVYLLKSIQKNPQTALWMREMDDAQISTWLHCLTASTDLENAIGPQTRDQLAGLADLPPAFGGIGLQSLERSADEEFLGSFAGISASLISFCRSTGLPVYFAIAEALEDMGGAVELLSGDDASPTPLPILQVREVASRTFASLPPSESAFTLATQLVKGHSVVEIPGRWSMEGVHNPPEQISFPDPRSLSDYTLAPCKHECSLLKQARHVRQALDIFETMNPIQQSLMRASAGQCGTDSAHCSSSTVREVALMDCPGSMSHAGISEGVLFCTSMLHRFGLPYDYAKLEDFTLPEMCPDCRAPLIDPNTHPPRHERIFTWQCHAGRCGGDGRRLYAHELYKLAMKRLVLTSSSPGGRVFPSSSVIIEPRNLRQDKSRPGDLYTVGNGLHRKDSVMDVVITSALKQSCLLQATKGSDYAIRRAESAKFRADARSSGPVQSSSTRRLVPLALNHLGLRGGHFNAVLKEFATILLTRPGGCPLLQGPFALSINGAFLKILNTWGSRLTWTAQREHAAQIVEAMDSFYSNSLSLSSSVVPGHGAGWDGGADLPVPWVGG